MLSNKEVALPPFSSVQIKCVYTSLHIRCTSTEEAREIYDTTDVSGPIERVNEKRKHIHIEGRYDDMKTAIASVSKYIREYVAPLAKAAYLTVASTNAVNGE